jgi:F1F0 ATPase subunit 2
MAMNDAVTLMLALGAGFLLGAVFFGGLWWTVRQSLVSSQPALWILSSLVLRTAISLAGIYFVAGGHWGRMLACLLGFLLARVVVTRQLGPQPEPARVPEKEAGHAP